MEPALRHNSSIQDVVDMLDVKATEAAETETTDTGIFFATLAGDIPSAELLETSNDRTITLLRAATTLGLTDPAKIVRSGWQEGFHIGFHFALSRVCEQDKERIIACRDCDITE